MISGFPSDQAPWLDQAPWFERAGAISVALWTLAGIIAVIAPGDALTVLAVVLAIVIMAGWICRGVVLRMASSQVEIARVCHSRPALTGQRDVYTAWSSVVWRAASSGVDLSQLQSGRVTSVVRSSADARGKVKAAAQVIVTRDGRAFPVEFLEQHDLCLKDPDDFVADLIDLPRAGSTMHQIVTEMAEDSDISVSDVIAKLRKNKMVLTATKLER